MSAARTLVRTLGVCLLLLAAVGTQGQSDVSGRVTIGSANPHIRSGQTVDLPLSVAVGSADHHDWSLEWEFVLSGAVLARDGKRLGDGSGGEADVLRVGFTPPEVRHVSNVDWRVRLIHQGQTADSAQVSLRVYPAWDPQPIRRLLDKRQIALVEQQGGPLARVFADHGLSTRVLSNSSAVGEFDGCVAVLGPDAGRSPALTRAALETAASGRTILWLEPGDTSRWVEGFDLPKVSMQSSSESVILSPGHPALREIEEADLTWWHEEATPCQGMSAPDQGNFRSIVGSTGSRPGVKLMELFPSGGRIILCRMPVVARFDSEPAARVLFENLLRYSIDEMPCFLPAKVWAAQGSGLSQLARKSGVETCSEVDPKGVIIVAADADAAAHAFAEAPSLPGMIRAHLESGGKCLFMGSGPGSARFLTECGLHNVSFDAVPKNTALEPQPVPLGWGISHQELTSASVSGVEKLVKHVVAAGSGVTPASVPGVLAKVRVGSGEAILCQFALDRAPEDPACILLFRELLTNLGVRLKREDQP